MAFMTFSTDTLEFLAALRRSNSHEWFTAHRREYEMACLEPARAFVIAAGSLIRPVVPGIRAEPRVGGSIFRIVRDTRYRARSGPYKDHLDFWFWEGERRRAVSGLFARISPDFVGIGVGCHGFDPARLAVFRHLMSDPGLAAQLDRVVADVEARGYRLGGSRCRSVPAGFPAAGPGSRYLRHKALFVHVDEPAQVAVNGALLATCEQHWRALSPLHDWITRTVQAAAP